MASSSQSENELQAMLDAKTHELESLKEKIYEALDELTLKNERLDECSARLTQKQRQIDELEKEQRSRESEIETAISEARLEKERVQRRLETVIRENVALRAQLLESEERINEFEQTISSASASLETAGSIPCEQCISLERLLEETRTELDQRIAQLSMVSYEKHQLREQIAGIEASHRVRTSGLEDAVKFDWRQLRKLQAMVSSQQKEIGKLQGQLKAVEELNKELSGSVAEKTELERVVSVLRSEALARQEDIRRLTKEQLKITAVADAAQMTEVEVSEEQELLEERVDERLLDTKRVILCASAGYVFGFLTKYILGKL